MPVIIESLHRYPIKGLKGETLTQVNLVQGSGIDNDRRFGLAFADSTQLLLGTEKWRPWQYFVSLKKYELLAHLTATFDDTNNMLLIFHRDKQLGRADINNNAEKAILAQAVADYLNIPQLTLVDSKNKPLWDDAAILTAVNSNTVADLLGDVSQVERFRANIVFSGLEAWAEESIKNHFSVGDAVLIPQAGVPRCAATWVNPQTAERDKKVPELIYKARKHTDLGIFVTIQKSGTIAQGMEICIEPTA